jgi:hypothetical protein
MTYEKRTNFDIDNPERRVMFHIEMTAGLRSKIHAKAKLLNMSVLKYAERVLEKNVEDIAEIEVNKIKVLIKKDVIQK